MRYIIGWAYELVLVYALLGEKEKLYQECNIILRSEQPSIFKSKVEELIAGNLDIVREFYNLSEEQELESDNLLQQLEIAQLKEDYEHLGMDCSLFEQFWTVVSGEEDIYTIDGKILKKVDRDRIVKSMSKYMSINMIGDTLRQLLSVAFQKKGIRRNVIFSSKDKYMLRELSLDYANSLYLLKSYKNQNIVTMNGYLLEEKGIQYVKEELKESCMILEKINKIPEEQMQELKKVILEGNMVTIIIGEQEEILEFFDKNVDLHEAFLYFIDVPRLKVEQLLEVAAAYIQEVEYSIDDEAKKELKNRIMELENPDFKSILLIIGKAIEKATQREMKMLTKIVLELEYSDNHFFRLIDRDFKE